MKSNSKLSREDWIGLARKALIASGVDDVKVDVLARRLKVTRGSFYWHFKNRQELLDALLADWEVNNRREIETVAQRSSGDEDSWIEIFKIWLGEDPSFPAFDIAVRVWAKKSRPAAKLVHEIDDAWVALFQDRFERRGMTYPESFVRARITYFHQIGYFALGISESLTERAKLAPYYYTALTGSPAPPGFSESLLALGRPRSKAHKKAIDAKP